MGVIPQTAVRLLEQKWLFPRYGGYSLSYQQAVNNVKVVSPLWGLFSERLGLSKSAYSCFPVMGGVIPNKSVL